MDEEDKADAEEARRLQTADSFTGFGSTAEERSRNEPFMDILKTSGDTMGLKLLRRMGWRDGQGIGPKVKRKARLNEDEDLGGQDEQETYMFAPDNSQMISFIRKNDRKGLGFEGEDRLEDISINKDNTIENGKSEDVGIGTLSKDKKLKKAKLPSRGGFGVGILNDDGSDDEDPYEIGPQVSYNRIIGSDKKKGKKPANSKTAANPLLNNKPIFISKKAGATKATSTFRRCHDGRLPLDGFILSTSTNPLSYILSQDGKYPPPIIPSDWKSFKKPLNPSATPSNGNYQSPADVAKASALDPKSRASLLGETLLPGKSVFDYLTPTARSRIASITNNPHLPPALNEATSLRSSTGPRSPASMVPFLSPETAREALERGTSGWLPYAEDSAKRTRYQLFLSTLSGLRGPGALPESAPGASTEDWVKEMQEFAHAAQIFKPMTGMMATRFTSSKATPDVLNNMMNEKREEGEELLTRAKEKPKDPAEEAARLGMYGPLTRSVIQFYPSRLLCKRFNVKPPSHVAVDPGGPIDGPSGASDSMQSQNLELVGKKDMDRLRMEGAGSIKFSSGGVEGGESGEKMVEEKTEHEVVVVDPERNEALEKERPGEEIFRAIFGDSDDE